VNYTPTLSGAYTDFTISPTLPDGLIFDPKTGSITGAATQYSLLTNYTITATGANMNPFSFSFSLQIFQRLVKTGQTQCWDQDETEISCEGTGQDGDNQKGLTKSFTRPTQHLAFTSDYTTTDNVTGLVWKSYAEGGESGTPTTYSNWSQAVNACSTLNSSNGGAGYAGKTDWRLPEIEELITILDFGKDTYPTIDTNAFNIAQPNEGIYSSNTYSNPYSNYFGIAISWSWVTTSYSQRNVRCVSGNKLNSKSYKNNQDGTVKDNVTGLLWQKCSNGQINDSNCSGSPLGTTWQVALNYCNTLSLIGKKWRLPNKVELLSLVDYSASPSLQSINFPNVLQTEWSYNYWSSTSDNQGPKFYAWPVNFDGGGSGSGFRHMYGKDGRGSGSGLRSRYATRCVTDAD